MSGQKKKEVSKKRKGPYSSKVTSQEGNSSSKKILVKERITLGRPPDRREKREEKKTRGRYPRHMPVEKKFTCPLRGPVFFWRKVPRKNGAIPREGSHRTEPKKGGEENSGLKGSGKGKKVSDRKKGKAPSDYSWGGRNCINLRKKRRGGLPLEKGGDLCWEKGWMGFGEEFMEPKEKSSTP